MRHLICMSFDGDYQTEGTFKNADECWERSNDMGSRWYFYPFHFVVTESGKTIVDSPWGMEGFNGKRLETIQKIVKDLSELPENDGIDVEEFGIQLQFIAMDMEYDKRK